MNTDWTKLHDHYEANGWSQKPSIFAETAISYFPKTGRVLELGAGLGQDSLFFASHGYDVLSTDIEASALSHAKLRLPQGLASRVTFQELDLRKPIELSAASFDVVYAHLSLHYFDLASTHRVLSEITRLLKPAGVLAFLVNSTSDFEYRTGIELEPDYFMIDDKPKRFFSVASAGELVTDYQVIVLDDRGESYKDSAKGVHNLIRFIGRKLA